MKVTSLILTVVSCLFAGQVWADNIVYLPTVAHRDNGRQKTVYEYNEAGYITSGKLYWKQEESGEYLLHQSVTYEYHQLSNGEYVQTKQESGTWRTSSAYDSNDMLLWKQSESLNSQTGQWELGSRTETVLNGNSIRTGIRTYNSDTQQYEILPDYTFDSMGRVVRYEGYTGEFSDIPVVWTYTWGSGRLYTAYSATLGTESMVYQNIVAVLNEQYFNPYELFGGSRSDEAAGFVPVPFLQPSYTDYDMHYVFYSGEMVYMGNAYVQTIEQDNANDEISEVVKLGNTEIQRTVYKQLANGGWSKTGYVNDAIAWQETKEYDSHGVMTRNYSVDREDGNITYQHEETFAIEYDIQGRPTKCVRSYTYSGEEPYIEEETYDAWIEKGATGIVEVSASKLPVAVSDGILYINTTEKETVSIYSVSGALLYSTTKKQISLNGINEKILIVRGGTGWTTKVINK